MFGLNPSHIRYWEQQFETLKPFKNKKGNRLFTKEDIETIRLINHLVKERGLTIKGARQKLKDNREDTLNNYEIVKKLQDIIRVYKADYYAKYSQEYRYQNIMDQHVV